MAVRKLSVALDESIADAAAEAASREGMSLSAWLTRAAERALTIEQGLEAVSAWERDHRQLTESELADADKVLDGLLSAKARRAS
jgi:hypothetical protein